MGGKLWGEYWAGRVLIDTENDVEITTKKVYDVASDYSSGELTANLTGLVFGAAVSNAATSGAVAIPITGPYQGYTTNATAAIAATLADGEVGQEIWIKLETLDTNNMVVTPANFNNGTTLTFDATGEVAHLMFVGTGWEVLYTTATVA
jgi:uncharacterized protein (DUF697 family)